MLFSVHGDGDPKRRSILLKDKGYQDTVHNSTNIYCVGQECIILALGLLSILFNTLQLNV